MDDAASEDFARCCAAEEFFVVGRVVIPISSESRSSSEKTAQSAIPASFCIEPMSIILPYNAGSGVGAHPRFRLSEVQPTHQKGTASWNSPPHLANAAITSGVTMLDVAAEILSSSTCTGNRRVTSARTRLTIEVMVSGPGRRGGGRRGICCSMAWA